MTCLKEQKENRHEGQSVFRMKDNASFLQLYLTPLTAYSLQEAGST